MLNLSSLLGKIKSLKGISNSENSAPVGKLDPQATPPKNLNNNSTKSVKNWYEERTAKVLMQRNVLLALTFLLLLGIIVSIIAITVVLNLRKFDPFVIQIDETTGSAKVVTPITSSVLNGNDELAKYFIKKYVIARETYNPIDFNTDARKLIRLYSTGDVFRDYLGYIKNSSIDPTVMYAQQNTTFLIVKSWTKLGPNRFMLRFSINETAQSKRVFNKISVIDIAFVPMELTDVERDINPVGFEVTGYRVDDDHS